jgi:hypothetical protein
VPDGNPAPQPTTAPEPPGRLASAVGVILLVVFSFGIVALFLFAQRKNTP